MSSNLKSSMNISSGSSIDGHISKFKIIVFVLVVAAFIVLAYFLMKFVKSSCTADQTKDDKTGECRKRCADGQLYLHGDCQDCEDGYMKSPDDGKCYRSCSGNEEPCGSNCYNPDEAKCMGDKTVCFNTRYQDYLDPPQCCPDNTTYITVPSVYFPTGIPPQTTVKDFGDKLKAAKIKTVTDKAFDDFTTFLLNNNVNTVSDMLDVKIMQPPYWSQVAKNINLLNSVREALQLPYCAPCPAHLCAGTCCPNDQKCAQNDKGSSCCPPENIHDDPKAGGQSCCPVFSTAMGCCVDKEVLDKEGNCATKCGIETCARGSTCVTINEYDDAGNPKPDKQYCRDDKSKCSFGKTSGFQYNPTRIRGKNGDDDFIPVCKDVEDAGGNGPFLFCRKNQDISQYTMFATDTAEDPSLCTIDDALGRASDYGRIAASWDPKTGVVTEEISCAVSPVGNACTGDCPATNGAQCCKNPDSSLTGTICPENQVCWLNPASGKNECAIGFKYGWDAGSNKWTCQAAQSLQERVYNSYDECKTEIVNAAGKLGHPACMGDANSRGSTQYPNAWMMRNGVCYRNIPAVPANTAVNMECGVPGAKLATALYHPSQGTPVPFCADYVDITPKNNTWCEQHDEGSENANWRLCETDKGCTIDNRDGSVDLNHRYYYGGFPIKMNSCSIPPPET